MISQQLAGMLKTVASALGDDIRREVVFVGGCTIALFITDTFTLQSIRSTQDVDLICDLAGYADWNRLQASLKERGFTIPMGEGVICRMHYGPLIVDFMPDDERILGFSNRWYRRGIETAQEHTLDDGQVIRILTPPMFLCTKLEAWKGRGAGDLFTSKDAEDIINIVDGREELLSELQTEPAEVRSYVAEEIHALLNHPYFYDFLDGMIRTFERADVVRRRFEALAKLD